MRVLNALSKVINGEESRPVIVPYHIRNAGVVKFHGDDSSLSIGSGAE